MNKKALLSPKVASRVKAYSALAGAAVAGSQASAAIVYTDVNPDFMGGVGSQYFLDLNNDGTDDFRIYHNGSYNLFIEPLGSNNEVLGSGSTTYAYPYALSMNSPVSASATGSWFNNGYSVGYQSLNYGSSASYGNWSSVTDRYLGLRFQVGGNTYYAWCRLDVDFDGSNWVVKDYAYEDVANTAINAGATASVTPIAADTAFNTIATDIANNNDANDIEVMFTAAAQENTIDEYRLIIVKETSLSGFDLTGALALTTSAYEAVAPAGNPTYTQVLSAGMTDSDGDPISSNVQYRAVILNMPDGTNANTAILSSPSSMFLLDLPADVAINISPADIADANNASDIEVSFSAAANESTVGEYRIMVVKTTAASGFNLATASAVPATAYEVVNPTGAPGYTQVLSAGLTDTDGDPIVNYTSYTLFIMSTPGGSVATLNGLSAPSSSFILEQAADPVANIAGADIGNNDNGTDLEFTFDAAANENSISEYRVIAVKNSSASIFDLTAAQALPATAYSTVTPTGASNYTQVFGATTVDSDNDPITSYQAYRLFVWSVADGTVATVDRLTGPSSNVTLELAASEAINVQAFDINDLGDGQDLEVQFDAAAIENTITEYRILVVKSTVATSFDLASAQQAVNNSYYTPVSPDGSANYTEVLSATSTDTDGDLITTEVAYEVFIYSMPSGLNATLASLSTPSSAVTLETSASAAANLVATDVDNNGNGLDLQLEFAQAPEEAKTDAYRLMIVKSANAGAFDLAAAQAVSSSAYTVQQPDGSTSYSVLFTAATTDVDGDLIAEGEPYQVFILSTAGGPATEDVLSDASNEITLSPTVGLVEQTADSPVRTFGINHTLIVDATLLSQGSGQVELYDLNGRVVLQRALVHGNRHEFEVSNSATGVYISIVKWGNTTYRNKVVLR